MLAEAVEKFIREVGIEKLTEATGDGNNEGKIRTRNFFFDRAVCGPDVKDLTFALEVKASDSTLESSESSDDKNLRVDGNVNLGIGPFNAQINIKRSIVCHEKNAKALENASQYHADLLEKDYGPRRELPECWR